MGEILLRIRTWWDSAERNQRTVVVVGVSLLACLLLATFVFAFKPKMGLLYGNLSDAEQGSVVTEVQGMGVPVEMDGRGNVLVPTSKIAEVRARLAMDGKTPRTSHLGDEDLDKLSMGTTPPVERERLKAILEGKLAQSMEVMEGVQAARVHISLEENSPFVSERKPAKATVTLIEKPGALFSPEKGRAIALMVANAVQGLDISNVLIVNQFSEPIYDPMAAEGQNGIAATKLDTERSEAKRRRVELQADLDRAFGPGATIAQISNLEIDFDDRQVEETTNTPSTTPVAKQTVDETMNGGTSAPAGIAGMRSNLAPAENASIVTSRDGSYSSNQSVEQFAHNTRTERTKKAAGTIVGMAVNVVVDSNRVSDIAAVDRVIAGFLGAKSRDERFTKTVTSVPFDLKTSQQAQGAAAAATQRERLQQIISLLPVAALLLVGAFVAWAIGKAARTATVSHRPDVANAYAAGEAYQTAPHGNPGAPSLYVSQDLRPIAEKANMPLEQIRRMAEQRPDAVATVMKGWLADEGARR